MHFITKLKSFNLLFVFTLFLFFSCENHVQEIREVTCDPNTSFVTTVKPIIDNNCIVCHGGGGSQSPNLTTYSGVSGNANIVVDEIVSGRMPQGGELTIEEIDAIKCWVDNGALDN